MAIGGPACISTAQPNRIPVAIVATTIFGAVALFGIARVLLAPRMLARARDPQLAAAGAITAHDRATLAEIAKHDANASAKQQYVATLQAAGSPPDLVAKAQAELQHAREAAAELRGRLLEPALNAARSQLSGATAQQRALRAQGAPPEAFGAVDAAVRSARAEIARLAAAAGWTAWATALWQISLASGGVLHVRATEVFAAGSSGPRVIAAAFSVAPTDGAKSVSAPVPKLTSGARPVEPEIWLATPLELSRHLADGETTVLIGSDSTEFAAGATAARNLLASWKNVKLEFVGNVRVVEKNDVRTAVGYARWRGKSTLFRVFGVFRPAEVQGIDSSPMAWELATAHYSIVPDRSGP